MTGQSSGKSFPRLPLVFTAIKGGFGSLGPPPERRRNRRGSRKKYLGPRRMADQLRHITAIQSLTGVDEVIAAVGARVNALARSCDHDLRVIRHHRDGVRIEFDAVFDILPACAAVLTADHPTLLHRAKDEHRIVRAQRQSLDMAHMGRPRESPIDSLRQLPKPFAVNPTIAAVNALKD